MSLRAAPPASSVAPPSASVQTGVHGVVPFVTAAMLAPAPSSTSFKHVMAPDVGVTRTATCQCERVAEQVPRAARRARIRVYLLDSSIPEQPAAQHFPLGLVQRQRRPQVALGEQRLRSLLPQQLMHARALGDDVAHARVACGERRRLRYFGVRLGVRVIRFV